MLYFSRDIPEWTDEDFANAISLNGRSLSEAMKLHKTRKAPITARIDMDILEWLKKQRRGDQTRLNTILREAMRNDLRHHHSK
ncbi:MAG: BrnA antitoxin family protein [Spirochaetota bacterium]